MRRGRTWVGAAAAAIVVAVVSMVPGGVARAVPLPEPAPARPAVQPTEEAAASIRARATGARVEVAGARAPDRRVWANPDGTFAMELTDGPTSVRKGDAWVPVDTTLAVRADGSLVPKAAVTALAFSGGGSAAPLVQISDGTHRLELHWPYPLPAPTVSGATATYVDVLPGVDLRLTAAAQGYSEALVVKRRSAAADPRLARLEYGLRTANLTLVPDGEGGLSARAGDGTVAFAIAPSRMWDSTPAPGGRTAVATTRVSAGRLSVLPDRALLTDPGTRYPVIIDPDVSVPGAGWTKVFSGHPTTSYWNGQNDDGYRKVGYCGWSGCNGIGTARSFVQFAISSLNGTVIRDAKLTLDLHDSPSCDVIRPFDVWQTGAVGSGTTWNKQPSWTDWIASFFVSAYGTASTCMPRGIPVNVKQTVANLVNAHASVATFGLKANSQQESDKYTWKRFSAQSLYVEYNHLPNTPTSLWSNVGQGPSLGCPADLGLSYAYSTRPTLHATVSDSDGQNVKARFEWYRSTGSGRDLVGSADTPYQASGLTFGTTVPDGAFADGDVIHWRVAGYDGMNWGGWSGYCAVKVDMTPPVRPDVTSIDYPEDATGGYVGKTGAITVTANDPDVVGFQWSLNFQDLPPVDFNAPTFVHASGGQGTILITPTRTGLNNLYVRAVDAARNVSPVYAKPDGSGGYLAGGYAFFVGSAVPPPAGYWPMDGFSTATTVPDLSDNNHTGTVTGMYPGSTAAWTTGRVDDALHLAAASDGKSGGYVATAGGPAVDTSGTFTVSAWVRLDRADDVYHAAVSQDGDRVFGMYLGYMGNTHRFAFRMVPQDSEQVVTVRATASTAPALGVWTHLAGVYDVATKEMRLYVNGVLDGTATLSTPWASNGALQIGRAWYNMAYGEYWPGDIDEVRVWNRLLSEAEIRDLANSPTVERAFYPLDEGDGTVATDASGNLHNATLGPDATRVAGPVGTGAIHLDGTSAAATTAGPVVRTDGSFTVTAMVRLDSVGTAVHTAVGQDGGSGGVNSGFLLQYRGDSGRWALMLTTSGMHPTTAKAESPATVTTEWTHLAGVYDAAAREIRLYVNGALEAAVPYTTARWNSTGGLTIGRAQYNGAATDFWNGSIDDVHVYTGVRSADQILADFITPVTARPTFYTGQLSRYVSHSSGHFATTGPVPPGYHFENGLGFMAPEGAPDTVMLYSCLDAGGRQFTSLATDCEGQTVLGEVGLVYSAPPADAVTVPVYRCLVPANGDHFDTRDPNCEGKTVEGLLGYTLAYRKLFRYLKPYVPTEHWATTTGTMAGWGPTAVYQPEAVLGLLAMTGEPGTVRLTSCVDGTDEFLSTDAACDGKQVRYVVGYLWTDPPVDAVESARLFSCAVTGSGERFASVDPYCEGQTVIGPLGYVVEQF